MTFASGRVAQLPVHVAAQGEAAPGCRERKGVIAAAHGPQHVLLPCLQAGNHRGRAADANRLRGTATGTARPPELAAGARSPSV